MERDIAASLDLEDLEAAPAEFVNRERKTRCLGTATQGDDRVIAQVVPKPMVDVSEDETVTPPSAVLGVAGLATAMRPIDELLSMLAFVTSATVLAATLPPTAVFDANDAAATPP